MPLKLMYITNKVEISQIAERYGVDRIFVDMEYIGKDIRQGGMNTVQNHHTLEDVKRIKESLSTAELLVRCNPIHDISETYTSSEEELEKIISYKPDYVMLPYFKVTQEVARFLNIVKHRCKTILLFETPEAVQNLDEIMRLEGIDEVFVGLNDLSLGYHKTFMFELLEDGTVDMLAQQFRKYGKPFGFGGIAAIGKGTLPAEKIIKEHYRLMSHSVILSRSFCDASKQTKEEVEKIFSKGIKEIRQVEAECERYRAFFVDNQQEIHNLIRESVKKKSGD